MVDFIFWGLFIMAGLLHVGGTYFPTLYPDTPLPKLMMISAVIAIIQYAVFKTPAIHRIRGKCNSCEVESQWIAMTFVFALLFQKLLQNKPIRKSTIIIGIAIVSLILLDTYLGAKE
jgi:drug/metabolite transporter superfamily protein YnfA